MGTIKKSVVTIINYDVDGKISSIGSGFFISKSGILVTNFHVLDGAYNAEIRTLDGSQYPVATVLARNQLVDLIKVRVDIPGGRVTPVVTLALVPFAHTFSRMRQKTTFLNQIASGIVEHVDVLRMALTRSRKATCQVAEV